MYNLRSLFHLNNAHQPYRFTTNIVVNEKTFGLINVTGFAKTRHNVAGLQELKSIL